jgi:hypothetical protein
MSDPSPLDGPPLDGLARAFQLPPLIAADQELSDLHAEIVRRLRQEAAGLPMNTVQNLLLERIATFYVQSKQSEQAGTANLRNTKEQTAFWLSMTQEFNRLLTASDDKLRQALFEEVQQVVVDAVKLIEDKETRQQVRQALSAGFALIDV